MMALLALLPVLLFILLLVGFRFSAALSGFIATFVAFGVALSGFGYVPTVSNLLGPTLESLFISATILWIIFAALSIHEYQKSTGQTEKIGQWLSSVSKSPQIIVLLLAWFFALFLEGAAGFGTPVALVAPMLVALGFPPVKALVFALLGHAVGVSFGAAGTPIMPLINAFSVDTRTLSLLILALHGALGWSLTFLLFRSASENGRNFNPYRISPFMPFIAAFAFFIPAAAFAWLAGPELPTLGGALVGGTFFVALVKWIGTSKHVANKAEISNLIHAALPYILIIVLISITRLVPPLTDIFNRFVVTWTFAETFRGTIVPLYHPGTILMVALLLAAALGRNNAHDRITLLKFSLLTAAKRLPPVALALVAVLLMARVMVHSGMINALASVVEHSLGSYWVIAVPLLGVLGAFVTGSATASNIIFADFQVATAQATGLSPLHALVGQGFGSAIGNIIAPHNIVAGAATVGLIGREGEVFKKTLLVCLAYALCGGLLLWGFSRVW